MLKHSNIHKTAIIASKANLSNSVKIGPYCIIGPNVTLGDNVELKSHVVVDGNTFIGSNTKIYPFSSIGQTPQILDYEEIKSEVFIGINNIIREYVTIQSGSKKGTMVTRIGDNCLFMVGSHIAHDCYVGNNVVLANYVSLAGHVEIGDYVTIGGLSAVHQYVRIGSYSMIGGVSAVVRDLIPFGLAYSNRATLNGINLVGMKRWGFSNKDSLESLKAVEEIFSDKGIMIDRVKLVSNKYKDNPVVELIINFLQKSSDRAFCTPKNNKL